MTIPLRAFNYPAVLLIFFFAFANAYTSSAVEWTLFPFLRYVSPSTVSTAAVSTRYLTLSAITQLVPIPTNLIVGFLAARIGPVCTLALGQSIVSIGSLLLTFISPVNAHLLEPVVALYSVVWSLRVLRLSILSDLVEPARRTAVMGLHLFSSSLAAFVAPVAWAAMLRIREPFVLNLPLAQPTVDRFVLNYAVAFVLMSSCAILAVAARSTLERGPAVPVVLSTQPEAGSGPAFYRVTTDVEGSAEEALLGGGRAWGTKEWVFLFTLLLIGPGIAFCVIQETFQPAVMGVFGATAVELAYLYKIVAAFSVLPPLLAASLSTWLCDRDLMVLGLSLKLAGAALYMPVCGGLSRQRVVLAYMLVVQASEFFNTAVIALFTKKVGGGGKCAEAIGVMYSMAHSVPALLQVALAGKLMSVFGTWMMGVAFLPTVAVLIVIASPCFGSLV